MASLTADDKVAIIELISRFAHCSDYGDWAALETLYTADVVTELEGHAIRYEGIADQIRHAQVSAEQTNGKNRHYFFNFLVGEADGAVIAEYFFLNVNAGAQPLTGQIVTSGRNRDTVERTPDGWKISRRFVRFDQSFDLDF
ncbi:nuclear transport factor 2 family protein [Sphingomonas sp. DBB INV C78]|uniref:nuclear transport factor 2 family protein n=1 Tax=Sphingomonas sp. DBB INV C78 TaxID=3349434 RepID=UPI0036D21E4A